MIFDEWDLCMDVYKEGWNWLYDILLIDRLSKRNVRIFYWEIIEIN